MKAPADNFLHALTNIFAKACRIGERAESWKTADGHPRQEIPAYAKGQEMCVGK